MAKKKIVINNQELTPTVLAIKQDKKKSSIFGFIWVVFIFGILIGAVYFMPQITTYVKQFIMPETLPVSGGVTSQKPVEETPTNNNIFDYSENLKIEYNGIVLSDFSISNGQMQYTASTNKTAGVDLSTRNIFVFLYDANNNELQVSRLTTANPLKKDVKQNVLLELKNSNVAKIKVIELKESDYPAFIVNTDSNGSGVLTCSSSEGETKYYFNNNKLYAVSTSQVLYKDAIDYEQLVSSFNDLYTNYSTISGVTTSMVEETTGMKYTLTIDLSKNDGKMILGAFAFEKDKDASIVKFNLEASGYSCN